MPRFAANVSTMFPEVPVDERFAAARAMGFHAVEYLFPYAEPVDEIKRRLDATGIRMILLNTPLGDAAKPRVIHNPAQTVPHVLQAPHAIIGPEECGIGKAGPEHAGIAGANARTAIRWSGIGDGDIARNSVILGIT